MTVHQLVEQLRACNPLQVILAQNDEDGLGEDFTLLVGDKVISTLESLTFIPA